MCILTVPYSTREPEKSLAQFVSYEDWVFTKFQLNTTYTKKLLVSIPSTAGELRSEASVKHGFKVLPKE